MVYLKLLTILSLVICVISFNIERENPVFQFSQQLNDAPRIIIPTPPPIVLQCESKLDQTKLIKCVTDAAKSWDIPAQSGKVKNACCAGWDMYDCEFKMAKEKCTSAEISAIELYAKQNIVPICKDYPDGSIKCHFPWWGIALIVVGVLTIIGVIAFFVYRSRRHRY